jgi:hypothetical protein
VELCVYAKPTRQEEIKTEIMKLEDKAQFRSYTEFVTDETKKGDGHYRLVIRMQA